MRKRNDSFRLFVITSDGEVLADCATLMLLSAYVVDGQLDPATLHAQRPEKHQAAGNHPAQADGGGLEVQRTPAPLSRVSGTYPRSRIAALVIAGWSVVAWVLGWRLGRRSTG